MASIPQPEPSVKRAPRLSEWKRRQQIAETVSTDVPQTLLWFRQALIEFGRDRGTGPQRRYLDSTVLPCLDLLESGLRRTQIL
jgi:hypothetical protein